MDDLIRLLWALRKQCLVLFRPCEFPQANSSLKRLCVYRGVWTELTGSTCETLPLRSPDNNNCTQSPETQHACRSRSISPTLFLAQGWSGSGIFLLNCNKNQSGKFDHKKEEHMNNFPLWFYERCRTLLIVSFQNTSPFTSFVQVRKYGKWS